MVPTASGQISASTSSSSSNPLSSNSSTLSWIDALNSNSKLSITEPVQTGVNVYTGHSCLGSLYIFCTVSRTQSYTADVPEYVVEKKDTQKGDGYWKREYISDNIQRRPFTIELTIFESEMPANTLQQKYGMSGRLTTVKDALIEMADSGQVLELVTPDEVYENMVISSITFPEDDYLNAMEINITLQKVYFSQATEIAATSTEYEYSTESDTTTDTTETTEETDVQEVYISYSETAAQSNQTTSLLYKVLKFLGLTPASGTFTSSTEESTGYGGGGGRGT